MLGMLLACGADTPSAAEQEEEQPNKPELVLRTWQKYVDNSEFAKAEALSTDSGKIFLDGLKLMEEGFAGDEAIKPVMTNFLVVRCQEKGDNATCNYVIEIEEDENVVDSVYLVRQAGQWLVDIPEDALEPSKELEKIFEENKKVIQ